MYRLGWSTWPDFLNIWPLGVSCWLFRCPKMKWISTAMGILNFELKLAQRCKKDLCRSPFALGDNDVFIASFCCHHVWTVTLVAIQYISDNMKNPCHHCQVSPSYGWLSNCWHGGFGRLSVHIWHEGLMIGVQCQLVICRYIRVCKSVLHFLQLTVLW